MGDQLNNINFFNDIILLILGLFLIFLLPRMAPVYQNKYWFMQNEFKISRFLWGAANIPYRTIARAEVYIRDDSSGPVSKEAIKFSRDSVELLRKSGFKIHDCTNSVKTIILLIGDKNAYMISPLYSKAFLQKLRKRVNKLPVKLVELTSRGKRIKEFFQ